MCTSILEIDNKADLMDKIAFMKPKGIFANELIVDVLISYYVIGDLTIPSMSSEDIYYECLKIACNQIAIGGIRSKRYIAEQLMNVENRYLKPDKVLAEFLINLAAYENEPDACDILEIHCLEIERHDLAKFWNIKSQIGCLDKIGIPLNLVVDKKGKYIEISLFD